jgi:DNA-binding LacI/PurR family transcriptional regulator
MHVLYSLTRAGLAASVDAVELPDYDTGRQFAVEKVADATRALEAGSLLYVMAGDDEIALAVNEALREMPVAKSEAVRLVGYDGTKSASGEYDVLHARCVVATVDLLTEEWGRQVADYLRAEREAAIDRLPTETRLEPQFVTFDSARRVTQAPGTRLPNAPDVDERLISARLDRGT